MWFKIRKVIWNFFKSNFVIVISFYLLIKFETILTMYDDNLVSKLNVVLLVELCIPQGKDSLQQ